MKKVILWGLALFPALGMAQNNFTLKGKIGNLNLPAKIYLTYSESGKFMQDSASLKNGVFQFNGKVSVPAFAELKLAHDGNKNVMRNVDQLSLYLEAGTITVTGKDSVKHATIAGSPINADEKRYVVAISPVLKQMDKINSAYYSATEEQKKDAAFKSDWQAKLTKARAELRVLQKQFIRQNPESYFSLITLTQIGGAQVTDVAEVTPLYKGLSSNLRNSPVGKKFQEAIQKAINTAVGVMAPVFTQNDVNDKPVSLTDFRGKYVLIDFWASWCGPCRAENPNYVKAYHTYKDKGFTMLGVSLDRPGNKNAWLAAIKADGLEWTQVSDLKFWNNEVALLYGIDSVPQNFLIDPTGKIIATNLRGDELNKKLASIFN